MHDHRTPRRRALLLTAAVACAAATALAACGSSSPTSASPPRASTLPTLSTSSTGGGSNVVGSSVAFSKCMRADGVPNFPDLSSSGMRIAANGQTISVNGVTVNAPAFEAARQRCQIYLPHVRVSQAQTARLQEQGLRFARCVRSHGVPDFPDPKVVTRSGGNQEAFLPGVNMQSPAFQAAAKACGGGPKGP